MIILITVSWNTPVVLPEHFNAFARSARESFLTELLPCDQAKFRFKLCPCVSLIAEIDDDILVEISGVPHATEKIARTIARFAGKSVYQESRGVHVAVSCLVTDINNDREIAREFFVPDFLECATEEMTSSALR